jgi:putative holliday junction resolvase
MKCVAICIACWKIQSRINISYTHPFLIYRNYQERSQVLIRVLCRRMPFTMHIHEFSKQLEAGRLLALDLGEKRIGVAVSDTRRVIASPFTTLAREKFSVLAAKIQQMILEERVVGLVIGYPLQLDGKMGQAAQSARSFAENFCKLYPTPILLADERLTTAATSYVLREASLTTQKQQKVVDKVAATYLLQGVLDSITTSGG